MYWLKIAWTAILGIALSVLFSIDPLSTLAQAPGVESQKGSAVARIISPEDEMRVPRKAHDPPCPTQGPCTKVYVKGQVIAGYWPFLAVAPLNAAPWVWIQPPIVGINSNSTRTFIGMAYLGTNRVGAGEKYKIFIIAHRNKSRFVEGEVLMGVPQDCAVSNPVTVLRTK